MAAQMGSTKIDPDPVPDVAEGDTENEGAIIEGISSVKFSWIFKNNSNYHCSAH